MRPVWKRPSTWAALIVFAICAALAAHAFWLAITTP
jgi:hypothetical protein